MTSIINAATWIEDAEQPAHKYWIEGTVEVTLDKKTVRVKAIAKTTSAGHFSITASGMTGRYQTGMKAWPAQVTQVLDPTTNNLWDRIEFGRDERSGRCKKAGMLFFSA